ncbi:MAG: DNA polymerase II large subunit [Candidatus Altiarchaeota archaeon]
MDDYFSTLRSKIDAAYVVARRARSMNIDPVDDVEAIPAGDLAARVEGRVGPPGIAKKIRELGRDKIPEIIESILLGEFGMTESERVVQAVRTSLDILTEGVVAAPIEGISDVKTETNPDGSKYLSIYYAGPIRSAGGTAQGLSVLIGDFIRKKLGLREYRPTNDEVERYVEEIKLYNDRASRLQYMPSEDDIRMMVKNIPVCITGEPTETFEVPIHRNLPRIESNRIRGGMCLVLAEGIAQKSRKVRNYSPKLGLDWEWLSEIGKKKVEDNSSVEAPIAKFMDEIVGGRPIFAAPSAKGAFRLRYGRGRCSGIAAKCIHPATSVLVDGFIATGTQVKVEKPGKGCIITDCDTIEGPIVRLKDGSVVRVGSVEEAYDVKHNLDQILFLGDLLVSYGDFLQTNTSLLPAGFCEEWWTQLLHKASGKTLDRIPTADEALELSKKYDIPLHPRYSYCWSDIKVKDVRTLVAWLLSGRLDGKLRMGYSEQGKRILEELGVVHRVEEGDIVLDEYAPLLTCLNLMSEGGLSDSKVKIVLSKYSPEEPALPLIQDLSPVKVKARVGTYIGCRMGRPEKAKERRMQPAVHGLFPVGEYGGRDRSINAASDNDIISIDVARYRCSKCGTVGVSHVCVECGSSTRLVRTCRKCGFVSDGGKCPRCGSPTQYFGKQDIPLRRLWKAAVERVGKAVNVKGVRGMISEFKIPEPLEKGILRAANDVYVFKDGTIRFDATDAPLTHFRPREVGASVEQLVSLGYDRDFKGDPLTSRDQILELKVQDVVIPKSGADYLLKVGRFVDQLLMKVYNLDAFYGLEDSSALLGHLVVGLAPHTSAGIIGRIVGFTEANVCFAHPYWHAAKRRNCDGDEDSFMLLMDVLLNFSRKYLPEKRGGHMDAPLVVTTIMNPSEIDDEAHKMEIVDHYPVDFYEKTWQNLNPSEAGIPTVSSILRSNPYSGLKFTHDTSDINGHVHVSEYVKLETMVEKVEAQLNVASKIRAIEAKDVAELVINSHFLRDTYGNLRAFSRQRFRCVKCNANYRRVPLSGKCTACGGKILLTVSEGNVRKYLGTSMEIAEKYELSDYLKQRLKLLGMDVDSLFTNDLSKQVSLADYM